MQWSRCSVFQGRKWVRHQEKAVRILWELLDLVDSFEQLRHDYLEFILGQSGVSGLLNLHSMWNCQELLHGHSSDLFGVIAGHLLSFSFPQ